MIKEARVNTFFKQKSLLMHYWLNDEKTRQEKCNTTIQNSRNTKKKAWQVEEVAFDWVSDYEDLWWQRLLSPCQHQKSSPLMSCLSIFGESDWLISHLANDYLLLCLINGPDRAVLITAGLLFFLVCSVLN